MGYILILLYSAILLYALSKNNTKAFKVLIYICFFQNIGLVLVSRFINGTQYTILTLLKEIYVALLLVKLIFRNRRIAKDVAFSLLAIVILAVLMLIHGQGELKGKLASLRQLYLPFLFYAAGRMADFKTDELKALSRCFLKLCFLAVVFGVVEYILGARLWVPLGIGQYLNLKGVGRYLLSNSMPRSFYSFDLGLGYRVRRMASLLVDPVIMGQLFAFGFVISAFFDGIYSSKIQKIVYTGFLGIGLLLCMAKGGLVIAAFSFCILLRDISQKRIVSNLLLLIVGIVLVIYFGFALRNELSVSSHYNGLLSGIATLSTNPFGTGIGSAGNHAQSFGSDTIHFVSGDESYIGSMLAQTGIIGMILNLIIIVLTVSKANYKSSIDSAISKTARVLTMALFITSLVNYTAISFTSCFIYFIYSGATKKNRLVHKRISISTDDLFISEKDMRK